jgi:hypothetical protein
MENENTEVEVEEYDGPTCFCGLPVRPARNPDGCAFECPDHGEV